MSINWVGTFDRYTGYGRMGTYFVRELCRHGVNVHPTLLSTFSTSPDMQLRLSQFNPDNLTISLTIPPMFPTEVNRQWAFTMYEDTSIPEGWADIINQRCERLIVLCEHNAETFQNAGVTVPIHVVHGGTDPFEFPLIKDRPDRPYTFMCLGDRGVRKGTAEAWMAFHQAFGDTDDDVRLIIKIRKHGQSAIEYADFKDNRIQLWKEDVEHVADIYRESDAFVFPSYGEGWGMPPREASMMGLPTIVTNWAGLAVGCENWATPIFDYAMRPSQMATKDAQWAVPNIDDIATWMRWCYENPLDAQKQGYEARQWLIHNQTWEHSAKAFLRLLEAYG